MMWRELRITNDFLYPLCNLPNIFLDQVVTPMPGLLKSYLI